MSRTYKGSKPRGYNYWSARPFNRNGGCAGKFTKKRTAKAERQQFDNTAIEKAISEFIRAEACTIYVDEKSNEVEIVTYDELFPNT